jgi:hypothetical protein
MYKGIVVKESDYSAGDTFTFKVGFKWFTNPVKDYTVTLYSSQSIDVKDKSGNTNVLHMDGQSPSGFTGSNYKGMGDFNTAAGQDTNNDQNDHPDTAGDTTPDAAVAVDYTRLST